MRNYGVMCMVLENGIKFILVNVVASNEESAKEKALEVLKSQGIDASIAPDMGLGTQVRDYGPAY